MILAAGRGERMRPLTDHMPKPLLSVGGKPLIQHHIERLAKAGVRELVINLAWKGAMIREALGSGAQFGVNIAYSDEGERALETGGGIFNALPLLGDAPFLIVNGDVWTDFPFEPIVARFQESFLGRNGQDLAHLVLVPNPPQHPKGDFTLAGDRVMEPSGQTATYSGIAVYSREFFAGRSSGAFPLRAPMTEAIRVGRMSGECYEGRWFDIGTPQRLAELDERLRACGGNP
jgi:MurNAc alpha-1-phosphate uridylyltransferase